MPTDSERQKTHAANIASENNIMQQLGTTRMQAHAILHEFRNNQQEELKAKAAEETKTDPPVLPKASVDSTVTAFAPQPLTLDGGSTRKGGDQQPTGASAIPLNDMIVALNGTLDYTNILTDGRLDPV